ncbi:MAG TPA: hypothetical protein VF916_13005 [Ktedonobacterales bacterium]
MRVEQQLQAERDVVARLAEQVNRYVVQLSLLKSRAAKSKLGLKLEMTERQLARHQRIVAGLEPTFRTVTW